MIIFDDDVEDPSLRKPQSVQTQVERPTNDSPAPAVQIVFTPDPPPAYFAALVAHPFQPLLHSDGPVKEPAGRRFIKVFLIALLVYASLVFFTGGFILFIWARHGHQNPEISPLPSPRGDFSINECVQENQWETVPTTKSGQKSVKTSIALPMWSNDLFFLASGEYSVGTVRMKEMMDGEDEINVDVQVSYVDEGLLGGDFLCKLQRGDSGNGIGIFTPTRVASFLPGKDNALVVQMTIHLPAFLGSLNAFASLDIFTPGYSIVFDDLAENFLFGDVSLQSKNEDIEVEALRSTHLSIATTNRPIRGSFIVATANLRTNDALIVANMSVINEAADTPGTLSDVRLISKNGAIMANLSLQSALPTQDKGHFEILAQTENQPIDIIHVSAPVDSTLNLTAITTSAHANIQLDPSKAAFPSTARRTSIPSLCEGQSRIQLDGDGIGRSRLARGLGGL